MARFRRSSLDVKFGVLHVHLKERQRSLLGNMNLTQRARALNVTVLSDSEDAKTKASYEDKVFTITLLSVALLVLAVTGIIICISYHNRRGKNKWTYASTAPREVAEDPVNLTYARRTQSIRNPCGTEEELKHNSRIYYIFSNPTPVVLEEDETTHQQTSIHSLQDYANDCNNVFLHAAVEHQVRFQDLYSKTFLCGAQKET